jgi:hypothetical protein
MKFQHADNPKEEVLVFDIERGQTKRMPKSELDAKVASKFVAKCMGFREYESEGLTMLAVDPKNVQSIRIPISKSQIPIWLGDISKDPQQEGQQWFASVYIPPSIRLQRVFGRYDTLYVTSF